ncbi:hypothetical protein DMENIID0001_141500 [Sergentomyia squamirostris]
MGMTLLIFNLDLEHLVQVMASVNHSDNQAGGFHLSNFASLTIDFLLRQHSSQDIVDGDAEVDEVSNIERNFIALIPDRPTMVVNDEKLSNKIFMNSTIVPRYADTISGAHETPGENISVNSSKTSKLLQEIEDKWTTAGAKGRGWSSLAKQKYSPRTSKHHSHRHKHHHHHGDIYMKNKILYKKSPPQAHVKYFDGGVNRYENSENTDGQRDKWANLVSLHNQLQSDQELPPYMKKINRRTKQLRMMMEGETTVLPHRHRPHRISHHKWNDENVFEEQRRSSKSSKRRLSKIHRKNSLPNDEADFEQVSVEQPSFTKSATRAGNFIYHRVPSGKSNTGQTYGRVIRKQGLPFVAITDRRIKIQP